MKKAVKKVVAPVKKKQGVKAGTKRGSYKKHKEFIKTIEPEPVPEIIEPVNEPTPEPVPEIIEPVNEPVNEPINTSGDDNYKKFLEEYGTPMDVNEPVKDVNNNEPPQAPENKSYDFTNTVPNAPQSGISNNNTNLDAVKKNNAMLVNGYMLLALLDFVAPLVMLKVYGMIDERANEIKASTVKLDKDQKESLRESADAAAAFIFQHVNPLVIFGLGIMVFYGSNISTALEDIKKKPKAKKVVKRKPVSDDIEDVNEMEGEI